MIPAIQKDWVTKKEISKFLKETGYSKSTLENKIIPKLVRFGLLKRQREFKTGMVAIVMNGAEPSRMLLENLEGIRREWLRYWSKTTGGVSSMRTDIEGSRR